MRIEKKVWPEYFQAIIDGKKTFELRLNDFDCQEGDTLVLREWDYNQNGYTGRQVEKEVTYVAKFSMEKLGRFWPEEKIKEHGIQIIAFK